MKKDSNLAWLDMEMTGLNPDTDRIIEAAMIITNADLNVFGSGVLTRVSVG